MKTASRPRPFAGSTTSLLEVLKDQLNPLLYDVVERCLAEVTPAAIECRSESVSIAKAQIGQLLRNAHDLGPQCIQNAKNKKAALVIDPEDLAKMLLHASRPRTLAEAFSDLAPMKTSLPEDRARRGRDPFDLSAG